MKTKYYIFPFLFLLLSHHLHSQDWDYLKNEIFQNMTLENLFQSKMNVIPSTCSSSSPIVTGTGIFVSEYSNTDASGWRHFCDCNDKLLLSLNLSAAATAVIPDVGGVKIELGSTNASYYSSGTGFITHSDGAAMMNRRWEVLPTVQPATGEDVNVRFYYTQIEFMDLSDELANIDGLWELSDPSQMDFFKVSNPSLGEFPSIVSVSSSDAIIIVNDYNNPTTTTWHNGVHDNGMDHYAEYKVTSFSGGGGGAAGGGGSEILPVELSYFNAELFENGFVHLDWITLSEKNNEGFFIERSKDGEFWEDISFVRGNGNSTKEQYYEFLDKEARQGYNYYRLRQKDFDGKESLSQIREIKIRKRSDLNVFPNLTLVGNSINVFIQTERLDKSYLNVIDMSGRVLFSSNIFLENNNYQYELDTSSFAKGTYIIQAILNNEMYSEKIVLR